MLAEHVRSCPSCREALWRAYDTGPGVERTATVGAEPHRAAELRPSRDLLGRGESLGRYVVLDKLGEGGMSVVYVAYDRQLERKVALKLLSTPEGADPSITARFQREAQVLGKLSHPNVVALYDVLALEGRLALVMELVDGVTLRAWLEEKPRRWKEVLRVLDAAGQGLAAAHEAGLVHRDFKPENVLVGRDGRVRVADFGIARAVGAAEGEALSSVPKHVLQFDELTTPSGLDVTLTVEGHLLGTPTYMAPEQLMQGQAGPRTDQFAFAVTLYEALVGRRPFQTERFGDRYALIARGELGPVPPGVDVPRWLMKTVTRALAFDPEARYPSMSAFLAALQADPAAKRRRIAVATAVVVAAAGAVGARVHAVRQRNLACSGVRARLDPVWGAAQQRTLLAGFEASGAPYAAETATLATQRLDEYAKRWADMQEASCVATRLRGQQSEEVFALRTACLDQRLEQLGAVTRLLTAADPRVVERAPRVLDTLSRVEDCANLRFVLSEMRTPPNPALKPQVEALQARLAEGLTFRAVGRYPEAFAAADAVYDQGKALGAVALQAEARLLRSNALADTNQPSSEEAYEALDLAESVGADRVAAQAALRMAYNWAQTQPETALKWLRFVRAKLDRMGGSAEEEAHYYASLAFVQALGQADERAALETVRMGLAHCEPALGPRHRAILLLRISAADFLLALGEFENADVALARLLEDTAALLGPNDYFVTDILQGISTVRLVQGRYAEARRAVEAAKRNEDRVGLETWGLAIDLARLGDIDRVEGKLATAAEKYAHAARIADVTFNPRAREALQAKAILWQVRAELGERASARDQLRVLMAKAERLGDPQALAVVALRLGAVLREDGDPAGALPLVSRTLEILGQKPFDGTVELEARLELARVELALGHADRALEPIRKAQRTLELAGGASNARLAEPLMLWGRALAKLGRGAEAVSALQRGLELAKVRSGPSQERAEAKAVLAQLLEESAGSADGR